MGISLPCKIVYLYHYVFFFSVTWILVNLTSCFCTWKMQTIYSTCKNAKKNVCWDHEHEPRILYHSFSLFILQCLHFCISKEEINPQNVDIGVASIFYSCAFFLKMEKLSWFLIWFHKLNRYGLFVRNIRLVMVFSPSDNLFSVTLSVVTGIYCLFNFLFCFLFLFHSMPNFPKTMKKS